MKRFRDKNGQLNMSTDEVATLTLAEANVYYTHGTKYEYEGKTYKCNRFNDNGEIQAIVKFTSDDGFELNCDSDKLGTFLPDVASDGLEILKVYDIGSGFMGNGITYWNRAEEINNDYKTIAHIGPDRYVAFYEPLPEDVKQSIIKFAASGTPMSNDKSPIFYACAPMPPERVQYTEYQNTIKRAAT